MKTVLVLTLQQGPTRRHWRYDRSNSLPARVRIIPLGEEPGVPELEVDQYSILYQPDRPVGEEIEYVRVRPRSCAPCQRTALIAALEKYRWKECKERDLPASVFQALTHAAH